ncbi:Protein kinase domain [Trypanosoma vivax]|nr:putative protein kinase [Trypanosoma vivax]KAH8619772.1 Protein kinase domain [Trypanosoma vivax]
MHNPRNQIVGKYELGKVLASGYFDCRTRICTHIVTGAQYVVRIYSKNVLAEAQWMWERVRDAIHVMRTLPKHENIIEIAECFETKSSLYILMQLFAPTHLTKMYTSETASGQRIEIPLAKTKLYYMQIVRGVMHMHDRGVVHFGLAPDHVMVNERGQVKIGNLVSCKYVTRGKLCRDIRGTVHTVAPEVLRNEEYDPYLADAWSMGVLLYFMLHQGRYPHDGANTTKNILYHRIRPPDPKLPSSARSLLEGLLDPNPGRRMRVERIPTHPFLTQEQTDPVAPAESDSTKRANKKPSPRTNRTLMSDNWNAALVQRALFRDNPEDMAAYIIQRAYKFYKSRKQRPTENQQFSKGFASHARRSQVVELMCPPARPVRRLHASFANVEEEVALSQEKRQHNVQQQWSFPTQSTDLPQFFPASVINSSDSIDTRRRNSNTSAHGASIALTVCSGWDGGSPANSQLNCSVRSQNLLALMSHRNSSELDDISDLSRSSPIATGSSICVSGNAATAAMGLSHADPGVSRTMRPSRASIYTGRGMDLHTRENDVDNANCVLPNIKVDPNRPCPLCNRLPTQRLVLQRPYSNTPFVFEDGEFTEKPEGDSD